MKKKAVASLTVALLVLALSPMSAFSHGHGVQDNSARSRTYTLCSVEECHITSIHNHGDTYYAGHKLDDGHNYHQICAVRGCAKTTNHEHDGVTCFPHHNDDGHSYHNSGHGSRGHCH